MKEEIKNEVLRFLADRAPNYVRGGIIIRRLNKYNLKEIEEALEELIAEKKVKEPLIPKDWKPEPGISFRGYSLLTYENIPIRRTIKIGDISVPRILSTDLVQLSLEDINEAIETLSENFVSFGKQYSEKFKEEMNKQWGNLIVIFGIFVAIFSFIIVALPRIKFPPSYSFFQILSANTAQLIPVAIIFAIFVFVLKKLFR